jgi:hypothetical protein
VSAVLFEAVQWRFDSLIYSSSPINLKMFSGIISAYRIKISQIKNVCISFCKQNVGGGHFPLDSSIQVAVYFNCIMNNS